jgi:uncharacterized protein
MTQEKSIKLDSLLKDLKSLIVAFSGGVDSSFLIYRANKVKNIKLLAVTVRTPYMPAREINEAVDFAKKYNINHKIIDVAFPEIIRHNPSDRCYLCKKILFSKITDFAKEAGYHFIADGTNHDDTGEIRPGLRALKELAVRSPLAEAGLTKKEIRELSMNEGLALWDKPSLACLLTRIPYDTEVTEGMLRLVEDAEDLLFEHGYPGTRVRVYGATARIECMPGYLEKIINDPNRELIVTNLKKIGFRYISLDLEGYRTGSMNPENKNR